MNSIKLNGWCEHGVPGGIGCTKCTQQRVDKQPTQTVKSITNCPTCGSECTVGGDDKEGTHYYIPKKEAQDQSPWISVKDRLPEEDGNKIKIKIYDGSILNNAIRHSVREYWWNHKFFPENEVIEWCEMPELPNGKEKKCTK